MVYWDGGFPISSLFSRNLPPVVGVIGLLPWGLLIFYIGYVLRTGSRASRV
jgi:hypothetical protein